MYRQESAFLFAHNGVLYNEAEMQREYSLPQMQIETDSYTAVQVLETFDTVDKESVKVSFFLFVLNVLFIGCLFI